MEKSMERELQMLRADYNELKGELKAQQVVNERFFRMVRRRPALAVTKEIRNRMMLDIVTVPMVILICRFGDWPMLFGGLVSLWAVADLCATVWMNRKLGMDNLLSGDVRSVTEKISGYRRFYRGMLLVCIVPLVAMLAYIFMRLYALAESPDAVQLIVMSGVVFTSLACAVAVSQYRRHERNCRELMAQFEER
ncbi:hypothetical protein [uncultured Alistipes sp.]|jgi:ribosomal protein L29|uniref:hypothetical protein n=1 Tax=uncultured Alistipes sp. TaxID=538949 RepID=UPI001F9C44BF|nr:hypothetical protein [uncultured Alistipes sp.]HJC17302.1 hypothetical protein [Candidatus Alistipes stercorigallinarum]